MPNSSAPGSGGFSKLWTRLPMRWSSASIARPRQIAMYLAKEMTQKSLPEIGELFGGRDHTTVMHAVKKVEELMGEDNLFADEVNSVRRVLKGD